MRIIVGYGNDLRGEDGFGVEVAKKLERSIPQNTKIISCFQLTPELSLELLDAEEIIFVDAAYSVSFHYALACSLEDEKGSNLSHHMGFRTILAILEDLYGKTPRYEVFSLLTDSFENIEDEELYLGQIKKTAEFLLAD